MKLNSSGKFHCSLACRFGFLFSPELVQNSGFGQQRITSLFDIQRAFLELERVLQVSIVFQKVAGGLVPALIIPSRSTAELSLQTYGNQFPPIDRHLKSHGQLVPAQGYGGCVGLKVIEFV